MNGPSHTIVRFVASFVVSIFQPLLLATTLTSLLSLPLPLSPAHAAISLTGDVLPAPPAADPWTIDGPLTIGETLDATMSVSAGSDVSNIDSYVANTAGSTATVTIDGSGSTWTNSGELRMGNFGTGTLNITAGGAVSAGGNARIGNSLGGIGTATVDGPGSTLSAGNFILVGREGTGSLYIQNGAVVSDFIGGIAIWEGTTASVTVDGIGSAWNNSSELQVADGGTGTLDVQNGATVTSPSGYLGNAPDGIGTANVTGTGSAWNTSNQFQVGYGGRGTLNISAGAAVTANVSFLGSLLGGTGTVNLTGTGSNWTTANELSVGYEGVGTLSILDGATVSAGSAYLGNQSSGTGTVTVAGPASAWNITGLLAVGHLGTGSLHISGGGTVTASTLDGTGTLHFDAGTLRLTTSDFANNPVTLNPGGGTLDIPSQPETLTLDSLLTGPGDLTKSGAGTLALSAANEYTGNTRLDAGSIALSQHSLADLGDLYLAPNTSLALNFTGTDQIDSLFVFGAAKPAGTYGPLGSGADFELPQLTGTGLLEVTRPGLLGDYNDDGTINAADFTTWRDNLGNPTALSNDNTAGVASDDYSRWKSNFGQAPGTGSLTQQSAPIPEPATALLALVTLGLCILSCRDSKLNP